MSMLTREFNYMRKSQRVDIPLLVQIGGRVYKTADWSMTGLGVLDCEADIQLGDCLPVKLILPVVGASINIDVQVAFRNKRGKTYGFEFVEISDRHKRVLRHYVELSLEGKLDNIEDLFSDFSAPDIETPIKEALNISEEEQVSLLRKFRSRAFLTMFAGFLLMGYILFTIGYNLVFVYKAVGVVSGNLTKITAGLSGTLQKNYVKVGDDVHVNDILFALDDSALTEELRKNNEQIERQSQILVQLTHAEPDLGPSVLADLLREEFLRKEKDYENASRLFADKTISIKDYQFVENNYRRARIDYLREQEQKEEAKKTFDEKKNLLALKIDVLRAERQRLLQRLESLRIRSPINGVVFAMDYFAGEYLTPNDVVVTLAARQNPFILFKMPSKESGKAQLGMKVAVYSFETDMKYEGVVGSIGYSAIDPRTTLLQEVSLDQTIIRVDLPGDDVDIPLNSRVEVWVRKEIPYLEKFLGRFRAQPGGENAQEVR